MTQDQYGQARGPGYVVRGDVVADDGTEESPAGQSKPMTRFQKVASALPGGDPDLDDAIAVTSPDVPDAEDCQATQPDMFGTAAHVGNGATSLPYHEGPAGTATIADVPANGGPAAAPRAGTEWRPGEAAGTLGDVSDLTHGNLIPDAAQYTTRWQQVQFTFVDDPHASVAEAADLIAQVAGKLEAAIQERQRSLRSRWGEGTNADTEALRETLRMYRTFLHQLIGPGPARLANAGRAE